MLGKHQTWRQLGVPARKDVGANEFKGREKELAFLQFDSGTVFLEDFEDNLKVGQE